MDFSGLRVGGNRHRFVGDPVDPDHRRNRHRHLTVFQRTADLFGAGLECEKLDAGIRVRRDQGRLPGACAPRRGRGRPGSISPSTPEAGAGSSTPGGAPAGNTRRPGNSGGLPFLGAYRRPAVREGSQRHGIADFARETRSAPLSRDPAKPPNCCAPTTCSAASASASTPAISKPTTCPTLNWWTYRRRPDRTLYR